MTGVRRWLRSHPYTGALILAVISVPVLWAVGTYLPHRQVTPFSAAFGAGCGILIGAGWTAKWTS